MIGMQELLDMVCTDAIEQYARMSPGIRDAEPRSGYQPERDKQPLPPIDYRFEVIRQPDGTLKCVE